MRTPFVFLIFLIVSAITSSAFAEYYIETPTAYECDSCTAPAVVGSSCTTSTTHDFKNTCAVKQKTYHKPRHRCDRRSHVTFEEYAIWTMGPAYPCSYIWVPTTVCNGRLVCGHWQRYRCEPSVRYQTYPVTMYYSWPDYDPGSLDRATIDDNPNEYPDMDIDR